MMRPYKGKGRTAARQTDGNTVVTTTVLKYTSLHITIKGKLVDTLGGRNQTGGLQW